MFWAQNNNKVQETSFELDSITSSNDLVTHAAIAPDTKGKFHRCVPLDTVVSNCISSQVHVGRIRNVI